MEKDGSILINDFQKGIAQSPLLGYGTFINTDIYSKPGIVRPRLGSQDITGTVDSTPSYFAINNATSDVYVQCANNKVFKYNGTNFAQVTGNTTTSGSGNGAIVWNDYVIVARNSRFDLYSVNSATWTNDWSPTIGTLQSSIHFMYVGIDGILYFGNKRYLGRIVQIGTFDPASSGTYSFSAQYLDTKNDDLEITAITELGNYIVFGTRYSSGGVNKADIYYWDRTSSSTLLTGKISVDGQGIYQMVSKNNLIYFTTGTGTKYYVTNLSTTQEAFDLKNITAGNFVINTYLNKPLGAATTNNDGLLFGVGANSNVFSPLGVYKFKDKALVCDSVLSGDVLPTTSLNVSALASLTFDAYYVGYSENGTAKIDYVSGTSYDNYDVIIESPLYQVGYSTPKTLQKLEIGWGRALPTNSGVRIAYRTDLSAAFTTHATYEYGTGAGGSNSNLGAILYHQDAFGVEARQIQFQISMKGGQNNQLKFIRFS